MQLTFLGATETVTGSKYLLTVNSKRILVDCGLFQGYKELRLRNWNKLPVAPSSIDAVILTHAHIDHSGYIPLLVKNGFKGKIFSTPATYDLCSLLLPDSGFLQEEEAALANRYGYSKHKPALPLYTQEDALFSLKQFQTVKSNTPYKLSDNFEFSFHRAGHILGASFVFIRSNKISLLFSGDIGRPHDPVMRDPEIIKEVDYLVMESTYGNRLHEKQNPEEQLDKIINQTAKRGGSIIIPAFAVGRAQSLLYYIYQLKSAKRISDLPVFLDSPMAVSATQFLHKYSEEHHLSKELCRKVCDVATYVNTADDSKKIDNYRIPIIIISASGMATGGRVLHHLKTFAPDPRNTILFAGYQAGGTRGDRIMKGEREIKIHGKMIPVNAQIELLDNISAHADYQEILDWLSHFSRPPKKVFITHGESNASESLKEKIENKFGWNCTIPSYLQEENLS